MKCFPTIAVLPLIGLSTWVQTRRPMEIIRDADRYHAMARPSEFSRH
jgi:hypothetical protein